MKRLLTTCGIGLIAAAATLVPTIGQQRPSSQKTLLTEYCVTCHNDKAKTEVWEKVIRKLRAGLMPPTGARRPDQATYQAFRHNLEDAIDRAAKANPNPGATPLHRMNRAEYANAIRDLLAIEVEPATILPPDDSLEGLDN